MAYDSVPFVQSVLFQSPYSGCRCFSGWTPQTCIKPVGGTFPSPYNAPGAILCADRYTKTWKTPASPIRPIQLPPRPIRMGASTQAGRFTVKGPSSTGPFTYGTQRGFMWGGEAPIYSVGSGGAGGHNLGLG